MKFTGTLSEASGPGGRWVECPFDAQKEFGQARPPVVGTINGQPYRTRLMRYGGQTVLGLATDEPARAAFEALAFTHRKEYAKWVGDAKQPATRERRAAKAREMLLEGTKHP